MKSQWRLFINALWRQPIAPFSRSLPLLNEWFKTPMGEEIQVLEQRLLDERRREFRGEVVLISTVMDQPSISMPIHSALKACLIPSFEPLNTLKSGDFSPVVTDLSQLPFPENSVDLLILQHTLEFSANPHRVLNEAVRALAPRGHLLVVCFNPWSLFGIRRWFSARLAKSMPWVHHPLPISRVSDWLSLMNCEPSGVAQGFYRLPLQNKWLLKMLQKFDEVMMSSGLPGGGFYILHACKYSYAGLTQKEAKSIGALQGDFGLVSNRIANCGTQKCGIHNEAKGTQE